MRPAILAMLSKSDIRGDDALLRLAQERYRMAGIGAELYPETPEELSAQLTFLPPAASTAHLPRSLDLLKPEDRDQILAFARAAKGRLVGLTLHEHAHYAEKLPEVTQAIEAFDRTLLAEGEPTLYLEYTAALSPEQYARLMEAAARARRFSACIDVGHVGIQACSQAFRALTGESLSDLRPDSPELEEAIEPLERSVHVALPVVLQLIGRIAALGKPIHFHLHDGHPLSRTGRFQVSDHIGFTEQIAIPFDFDGRGLLPTMYGPAGLRAIVAEACRALQPEKLSFLLEIHPGDDRYPLGPEARFFSHWRELDTAEQMSGWTRQVLANARLLDDACVAVGCDNEED
jgi:hypothetical protein